MRPLPTLGVVEAALAAVGTLPAIGAVRRPRGARGHLGAQVKGQLVINNIFKLDD